MDLLALIIASFTVPAVVGALVLCVVGFLAWGWPGGVLGLFVGYGAGMWYARRYGEELSPNAKGWVSLILFLGGLTVLAIVTR